MTTRLQGVKRACYRRLAVRGPVTVGQDFHVGIGTRVWAPSSLTIADDVYIGKWCTVEVDGAIGAGTLIANSVGIVGRRDHDITQIGRPIRRARWVGEASSVDLRTRVTIESDVWIGYGATVLAPVTIGKGAVVAAGSVVVHDVAQYAIVAGNPAKQIATRLSPDGWEEHERKMSDS